MLLTAIAALLIQTPDPQWREFKAWGQTVTISLTDVQAARVQRLAAEATVSGEDEDPVPWYVRIRTLGLEENGERPVVPIGFICGRGHMDDENGINPILPHIVQGEVYDLVCYGEGEDAFLAR